MQKTKQKKNGHNDEDTQQILDELGLQEQILSSSESNPLLRETNLGLGKYDTDYKWQQVRSYRKGLYAWIAFGRVLSKRQVYETIIKLGGEGYNSIYDVENDEFHAFDAIEESDVREDESTWNAKLRLGRDRWQRLGHPEEILTDDQIAAMHEKTGIVEEWKPLFWELVAGRHEVSRSDDAELLRDALNGIKELRQHDETGGGLL